MTKITHPFAEAGRGELTLHGAFADDDLAVLQTVAESFGVKITKIVLAGDAGRLAALAEALDGARGARAPECGCAPPGHTLACVFGREPEG